MLRSVALALIASTLLFAAPAVAHDTTTVRGLLSTCVGCRLPHDLRGADLHDITFVGDDLGGGAGIRRGHFDRRRRDVGILRDRQTEH